MTAFQLRMIAALAVVATVFVYVDGTRSSRSDAALKAAARPAAVVHAALPESSATTPAAPARAAAPAPAPSPVADTPAPAPAPAPVAAAAPATPAPAAEKAAPKAKAAPKPQPSNARHVFVIALRGAGVEQDFGTASPAAYLVHDLERRGTLLKGFHPLDAADLPNELAMTGGQAPTADTRKECPTFSDSGCLYPNTVLSIADQVTAAGLSWRAYAEDMAAGPQGTQTCRHPEPGAPDDTLKARPGDEYATRHNPFVYFHSLLDLGDCVANDVTLDKLPEDLRSSKTTPNYAFIAPDLCDSGSEAPCIDGRPGGVAAADAFLRQWVPRILDSPAYRHDGVLIITFASSGTTQPTGTLVLSRFARAGATLDTAYNPYSMLRSVEDLFALEPLAHAKKAASFAKAALPKAFG